jgi:hypothetical protein
LTLKFLRPNSFLLFKLPLVAILFFGWFFSHHSYGQVESTNSLLGKEETSDFPNLPKNPRKATLLSAILPGAGQVYNEKAWKVPIIYAGLVTDIFFIGFNNSRFETFKEALIAQDNNQPNDFLNLNRQALVRNIDYWRGNRDLCYILLAGIYALNIIDATVDAHLSGFDISDDLSLKIEPKMERLSADNNLIGFSIKLNF